MMGAYADDPKADTGRLGIRMPGEPPDERPLVRMRPFWKTPEEQAAYLTAVRQHPRECDPEADTIESSMAYIGRIAGIVAKGPVVTPVKAMPAVPAWASDELYEREPGEEG